MDSNGKAMASLGTAGANDRATATGLHTGAKAVCTLATDDGRLISAFHNP